MSIITTFSHAFRKHGTIATTIATFSLASGCAAPTDTQTTGLSANTNESAVGADEHVGSASTALITPPAESGGFTYIADYTFKNAGLCIQPGKVDAFGIVPILGDCANAGAKLSVYRQTDGNYNICVRDSLKKGTYEDPNEQDYYAYVGRCLTRTDKNSLRFMDGVTLSIKWEATYEVQPGRFIDNGAGRIGYFGSDRLLTNVSSNAKLQSAGGGTDQVWALTKL